jgi:hypothetical protein
MSIISGDERITELDNLLFDCLFVDYFRLLLVNKYYNKLIPSHTHFDDFKNLLDRDVSFVLEKYFKQAFSNISLKNFLKTHYDSNKYLHIVFTTYCIYGNLTRIQTILNNFLDARSFFSEFVFFEFTLQKMHYCNHLDTTKLLIETYTQMAHKELPVQIISRLFETAVKYNQLEVVIWLHESKKITINTLQNSLIIACKYGSICVVEWLLLQRYIVFDTTQAFLTGCQSGHLPVMKLLIREDNQNLIDIHTKREFCFRTACGRGFFEMAQ